MDQTKNLLRNMNRPIVNPPKLTAIATEMYIPNHSGIASHPEFKKALETVGGSKSINVTIDGGGTAPQVDTKCYVRVQYSGTIKSWHIFGDVSGSCVIDVWKDTYANYPPTVADTIAGTEKPTLSSAIKNEDTTLSTWTTSVSEGDILCFNVDSATTLTKIYLSLIIE